MKPNQNKKVIVAILFLATIQIGFSQGSFVNLNFESPILPLTPDGFSQVPITKALPGWTGYIGGEQVNTVAYNARALDAAAISLHDTSSPSFTPIQGNYSVFIQGGRFAPFGAAIGQTAQIGSQINSLFFLAQFDNVFPGPQVTFAGQIISYFEFSRSNNYSTFAADVSALAGQTGELRFTSFPGIAGSTLLDGIRFSTAIVPEPSTFALTGIGAFLFAVFRKRLRKK